jgi:hypothetical protein
MDEMVGVRGEELFSLARSYKFRRGELLGSTIVVLTW